MGKLIIGKRNKNSLVMFSNLIAVFLTVVLSGGARVEGWGSHNYYSDFFSEVKPYMAPELVSQYSHFANQVSRALRISPSESDYGSIEIGNVQTYESTSSSSFKSQGENKNGTSADSQIKTESAVSGSSSNSNLKSAFGVNNILAVAHENIWTGLNIPGFNEIIRSAPLDLPEVLRTLLKSAEEDYNTKIRTIIFTPTWIKTTLRLIEMKCEVKQAYFEYPQIAMNTVNDVVRARFSSSLNFPPYLTEPLPDSTESFILNMKEQKGVWPGVVSYVGSSQGTFRGNSQESIEMFEVRGRFNYMENEDFILVTIPFKLTQLSLHLILPQNSNSKKNMDFSSYKSIYSSFSSNKNEESGNFRIHLPVKTFVSRNSLAIANSSRCNETGYDYQIGTCLDFTDTLTYTSFSPSEFQFVVLNGGVVTKQGRLYAHIKAAGDSNNLLRSTGGNFLERWRLFLPERKHLRHNHFSDHSIWRWIFPGINSYSSNSAFRRSHHSNLFMGTERLLIFNQHFNWFVRGSL